MEDLEISTRSRTHFVDITQQVAGAAREMGAVSGALLVFVPHTTAGITINENADPAVRKDLTEVLDDLVPWEGDYDHMEGNTAAHVKASMMGSSVLVPVNNGHLQLGRWQGIYLCEFDGPRSRRVTISLLAGPAE